MTPLLHCRLRGIMVAATPEERVRQQVIAQLLAWDYPWHLWRCEVIDPRLGAAGGRADLVFNLRRGQAAAVVEVKAGPLAPAEWRQALEQAAGYARMLRAPLWAATDGTRWEVRQRIEEGALHRTVFPRFDEWAQMRSSAPPLRV